MVNTRESIGISGVRKCRGNIRNRGGQYPGMKGPKPSSSGMACYDLDKFGTFFGTFWVEGGGDFSPSPRNPLIFRWALQGTILRPTDYESDALTG